MSDYDLIVRNARIITEDRQTEGDIAVKNGCIAAIEPELKGRGAREIDAGRKFVLPGGVDSHVHVEQKSGMGVMCADDTSTPAPFRRRSAVRRPSSLSLPNIAACRCAKWCRIITRRPRPRR